MAKGLLSEVTCPLCLDIFIDPKRLPCEHVYCRECLRGLTLRSFTGRISCPECRRDIPIPRNDVTNFSTPHQVNRLILSSTRNQPNQILQCLLLVVTAFGPVLWDLRDFGLPRRTVLCKEPCIRIYRWNGEEIPHWLTERNWTGEARLLGNAYSSGSTINQREATAEQKGWKATRYTVHLWFITQNHRTGKKIRYRVSQRFLSKAIQSSSIPAREKSF